MSRADSMPKVALLWGALGLTWVFTQPLLLLAQSTVPSPPPSASTAQALSQPTARAQSSSQHPWYDLHEGKISAARLGYAAQVRQAETSASPAALWNAYQEIAWFHHQLAENREAIDYANKALAVARKAQRVEWIGRSLSWLAWSYADLGLYDLAEQFYHKAIELGAPQGKITWVHVWGMSTQELGYLQFRRGNLAEAKRLLTLTTDYARKHGIAVGVAEGAAHLAEIALAEGGLSLGLSLAEEAIQAAHDCNCSPLNTARALSARARIWTLRALTDTTLTAQALQHIAAAEELADRSAIVRYQAEAALLRSRLLPESERPQRLLLVQSALDRLSNVENEERGIASTEFGLALADNEQEQLARTYLEQGLAIQASMFRAVDHAYAKAHLARIDLISGSSSQALQALAKSAARIGSAGATLEALRISQTLADELYTQGYFHLARERYRDLNSQIEALLAKPNPAEMLEDWQARKQYVLERLAETQLKLVREQKRQG